MNGFLLDTNILSELRKGRRCNAGVRQWFQKTTSEQLFVSVLVLGEIRQGIERIRLRDPAQSNVLEEWLLNLYAEIQDRLLPVDEQVADQWGRLGLRQPIPILDAFMAATAKLHDLTIVSRDVEGFQNTGMRLLNPFTKLLPPDR